MPPPPTLILWEQNQAHSWFLRPFVGPQPLDTKTHRAAASPRSSLCTCGHQRCEVAGLTTDVIKRECDFEKQVSSAMATLWEARISSRKEGDGHAVDIHAMSVAPTELRAVGNMRTSVQLYISRVTGALLLPLESEKPEIFLIWFYT